MSRLIAKLRSRQMEIEEAIFAEVRDGVPDSVGVEDAEYTARQRETVSAVVEHGLTGIELGEPWLTAVPPMAIEQAQRAARLGVTLETVLCRYIMGYRLLLELIMREADDLPSETGVLSHVLTLQASLLEGLVSSITRNYTNEVERTGRSNERYHAQLVQRLLDGAVDASDLGYELDAWHLGMIAKGTSALRALQILAATVGLRLLSVPQGDEVVWGWLGGERRLPVGEVERAQSAGWPVGVSLAVGEPARGIAGWRWTHRQAQEALRASRDPERLMRYVDVALLAPVMQNDLANHSLRDIFLAPLRDCPGGGAAARRTLRAYFRAGSNATAAAAELGVTRRTIERHVRDIEQRLGRLLPKCHAELDVALRLEELDNAAQRDVPQVDPRHHVPPTRRTVAL